MATNVDEIEKDTDVTELTELDATKVSGVGTPANGTPWLLMKSADAPPAFAFGRGGKKRKGAKAKKTFHTPEQAKTTGGEEADKIEDLVTGDNGNADPDSATKELCGVPDCEVCAPILAKAKLKAKQRNALPDSAFAGPDRSYPVHDASHARNALSRVSQHGTPDLKRRVRAAVRRRYPNIGQDKEAKKWLDILEKELGPFEKSPGVPDESVATPTEAGHIAATGTSGQHFEPMTAGATELEPGRAPGGGSTYDIPKEQRLTRGPANKAAAYAVASLMEAIDHIAADREAAKQGQPWQMADNPDVPIETLEQAATKMAALAWQEAAKADDPDTEPDDDDDDKAKKSGRRLSAQTQQALETAREHLDKVLNAGHETGPTTGSPDSEEDQIMTTLTKEELGKAVADASAEAVKVALKAERKVAKEKAKAKKAEAKKAKAAKTSANNNGEISEEEMRGKVKGEHPANDVRAVKTTDEPKQPKQGKALKAVTTGATELTAAAGRLEEAVAKMMKRPRSGGPIVDGQFRGGAHPAAEGRTGEVTKSAETPEIEALAKSLADEMGKPGPEAAARASDLSQRLTLERLRAAHESGQI